MSSIKVKIKAQDDHFLIRILIAHPMETGLKHDKDTGELLAAHFIQSIKVQQNGQTIADFQLSTAVSQNPYLSMKLKKAQSGDKIGVFWQDNWGQSDHEEAEIP